ncbi:hypothetical protein D3C76_709040 [compost metagenome]
MDDAGTVPQQHVRAGILLDVAPQVLVGCPDDLLTVIHQAFDDFQGATGGHDPVGTRLDRSRRVGIHHHGAIRMLVAECSELIDRATEIQRTGRFQGRHQHALFRVEDLGRFAHETHASHQHGLGRMLVAEASHLKGIGHATTGFLGQGLDHRVAIIMGDQHCILRLEFGCDGGTVLRFFLGGQRLGLLGVEVGLYQKAFGNLRHALKTCRRCCA